MSSSRPAIPEPMKREIRKRCNFGCVICGFPLYEYHHINDWSVVKRHIVDDITLLCRRCHGEATNKLLPAELIVAANMMPHNRKHGVSSPYRLHYSGDVCKYRLGTLSISCKYSSIGSHFVCLQIADEPQCYFEFENGQPLLSAILRSYDGSEIVVINRNELLYNTLCWDVSFVGSTLIIREGHGQILLEIQFLPPHEIVIRRGRFFFNNGFIYVEPSKVSIYSKCASSIDEIRCVTITDIHISGFNIAFLCSDDIKVREHVAIQIHSGASGLLKGFTLTNGNKVDAVITATYPK